MAIGDTVQVGEKVKRVRLVWDTGEVDENGNPILRRQTVLVEESATEQDCYDIAYLLASLSKNVLFGISVSELVELGPIT